MTAKKGRGYKTADENAAEEGEQIVGVIPVDSIFSPVRRVKYSVENTRVGQVTNYDRLTLELWTDGTVSPENALVEASSILRKHLHPFVKYFEIGAEIERREQDEEQIESADAVAARELREKLALPVSVLDPSVRAENCLSAENIRTIGDLVQRSEAEMLKVRNFGKTSLKEMKKKLADMGLHFGMSMEELVVG
jgi:DNA-directed RNA polymerase subunit alpha